MERYAGKGDPDDPRERKRQRILQVATERFIRHGYRKTNMDEIAHDAGVAKGTLYLYFKTKGELLLYSVVEEKRRYMDRVMPLFADSVSPEDRLRGFLRLSFVLATEMPLVSRLMSGDRELVAAAMDELPPELKAQRELDTRDFMGEAVRAVAPAGTSEAQIDELGRMITGLTFFGGLLTDAHVRNGLSIERFADLLSSVVVDGIGRPGGGAEGERGGS